MDFNYLFYYKELLLSTLFASEFFVKCVRKHGFIFF